MPSVPLVGEVVTTFLTSTRGIFTEKKPQVTAVVHSAEGITAAPVSVVSQVQSAISSASSIIGDINSFIPVNGSVGMRDFCINLSCHELPINFSKLLPDAVAAPIQAQLTHIRDLSRSASPLTLQNCLKAGAIFTSLFACLAMLDVCVPLPITLYWTIAHFALFIVSCALLATPTLISFLLWSKLRAAPLVDTVKEGVAPKLGLLAVLSVLVLGAATVAMYLSNVPITATLSRKNGDGEGQAAELAQ